MLPSLREIRAAIALRHRQIEDREIGRGYIIAASMIAEFMKKTEAVGKRHLSEISDDDVQQLTQEYRDLMRTIWAVEKSGLADLGFTEEDRL